MNKEEEEYLLKKQYLVQRGKNRFFIGGIAAYLCTLPEIGQPYWYIGPFLIFIFASLAVGGIFDMLRGIS